MHPKLSCHERWQINFCTAFTPFTACSTIRKVSTYQYTREFLDEKVSQSITIEKITGICKEDITINMFSRKKRAMVNMLGTILAIIEKCEAILYGVCHKACLQYHSSKRNIRPLYNWWTDLGKYAWSHIWRIYNGPGTLGFISLGSADMRAIARYR